MARRAKIVAIAAMLLAGGFSVGFAIQETWLRVAGVVLLAIGSISVLSIRTCEECANK